MSGRCQLSFPPDPSFGSYHLSSPLYVLKNNVCPNPCVWPNSSGPEDMSRTDAGAEAVLKSIADTGVSGRDMPAGCIGDHI